MALLGEYLSAQTFDGPATWIVIDDVDPASRIPKVRDGITVEVIRPLWRWKPGDITQAECILVGLLKIPDDAVIFILEDDDIILPPYIETMLKALETADLVGESSARYYNVRTGRYKAIPTPRHSSLASTAVRGREALMRACHGGKFIDITLWRDFKGRKTLLDTANVIGIKGLPGRQGIGVGHRDNFGTPDTTGVLEQWAGDYARNYDIFRRAA